jgi:hypothetical protein
LGAIFFLCFFLSIMYHDIFPRTISSPLFLVPSFCIFLLLLLLCTERASTGPCCFSGAAPESEAPGKVKEYD